MTDVRIYNQNGDWEFLDKGSFDSKEKGINSLICSLLCIIVV
jgi:hypothetical protein